MKREWVQLATATTLALMLAACGGGQAADDGGGDDSTAQKDEKAEGKDGDKKKEAANVPVEVAKVIRGDISASWRGSATLEADAEATVVARTSGIVEALLVEEGDMVIAGQPLARLDDDQLRLSAAQARADLDRLTADFARAQKVYRDKIISRQDFDRIRFDLQAARATHDITELNLKYTIIRAPIDGVVSARHIKVGNLIPSNAPAFQITRFDPLLAVLHVPEREIHKLKAQQIADLSFDAFPDEAFQGTVARVNPIVDSATGTVKITVEMHDNTRLKPGMFGRVLIFYDRHENTLLVPGEAVLTEDARDTLFVLNEHHQALRREVKLGFSQGDQVEVLEGLVEGDIVVTTGQTSLRDEALIEAVNMELPEAVPLPEKEDEDKDAKADDSKDS